MTVDEFKKSSTVHVFDERLTSYVTEKFSLLTDECGSKLYKIVSDKVEEKAKEYLANLHHVETECIKIKSFDENNNLTSKQFDDQVIIRYTVASQYFHYKEHRLVYKEEIGWE